MKSLALNQEQLNLIFELIDDYACKLCYPISTEVDPDLALEKLSEYLTNLEYQPKES